MLKILVVEDHALVREGLLQALQGLEEDAQAFGTENAEDALKQLESDPDFDLLLLDLMLPGLNGMTFLGILRKRFPSIPVVILSALDDAETVRRAIKQGAAGFVPKSSNTDAMLEALRLVLEGEVYLPEKYRDGQLAAPKAKSVAERFGLTNGQSRVLSLLSEGKTNKQIAELLKVTEGTVKIHVSAIFKALNVSNRAQALLIVGKQQRGRSQ